ncbi:NUDIX hydrolase [Monoraphidium neglectum]|uniref:NUDIX hydrolase n=1 Tax=Monoraphidium neglectum TaxID=145388 RepID=A0A0D2MHF6_9CHLO|nr:NUDIX hydrolase [Monoraphidium neglectum]KIY94480.1 NUDIX hydrolase [Monoraphidium neglectum]|eukprot:XP_013893500.1 NUDIX hydrolase [Monoraphidium neglectum]
MSKRSPKKDCYPSALDVTISGVVNVGEEYADTAARELREEIGVPEEEALRTLQQLFVFPYQDSVCHVWGCAFSITWDGPVAFTDAEVEWGRFVALREVRARLEADATEFTPVGRHILSLYLTSQQEGRPGQGQ